MLDNSPVLKVENVYKKFGRSYSASRKLLKRKFLRIFGFKNNDTKLEANEFYALHDVSFELYKGEALGILGLNGSGKSTLLKIINGLSLPDKGSVQIDGEVGGIIELGAGFKDELSGRENVFIKGALLGKSREEMTYLYDKVVEFSELEEFIDSPIKNYSSGMRARLGFAVAIHVEPDVLLMDEVLAVGDFNFQQKCLSKVNEMRENMTVLFVSHSMNSVKMFCDRALVLRRGKVVKQGGVDTCIDYYLEHEGKSKKQEKKVAVKNYMGEFINNENRVNNFDSHLRDAPYKLNEIIKVCFSFELNSPVENLLIGIPVWSASGHFITALNSDKQGVAFDNRSGKVEVEIDLPCYFNTGEYDLVVALVDNGEFIYRQPLGRISVSKDVRTYGEVTIPSNWAVSYE
jgi:ABC-type polysaccharide/polyol phosphate transport system ATPase subunit